MNIWIISLFEPTPMDNTRPMRYMSIANEGVKRGHNIDHFSCTFRHSTKVQRFEKNHKEVINDNYSVHYIYGPEYKENLSYNRVKSHKIYTNNLLNYVETVNKPDVVLVAFPPISTPYQIAEWCKLRKIPYIVDIIDPWPDNLYRFFPKWVTPFLKLFLVPYKQKVKKIFDNASGITAISNEYLEWASLYSKQNMKPVSHFYPSVPFDEIDKKLKNMKDYEANGKLHLIYAGSLEMSYDIPIILEVAELIEKNYPGKTEFTFCGAGEYSDLIKSKSNTLNNITFLGRLDYDDLLKEYKKADLGLAQYTSGAAQTVTYKLFDYLAAGLPVLNSLPTEMATIIEENNVGKNNSPDDPDTLFRNIEYYLLNKDALQQEQVKSRELTQNLGSNKVIYSSFIKFIEDISSK